MIFYEPHKRDRAILPHDPFKAIIAPRPIGWVTTMGKDGAINLAPLRKVLDFFKARGLVTSPDITVEKVIDMSFAQAAVRELGPYRRKAP